MRSNYNRKRVGIGVVVLFLIVCELVSLTVLFSRVVGYTQAKFYNLVSITGDLVETQMEIFHLIYDNESGKTTVYGDTDNADKLIAPGTSNIFEFTVHNPLDYTINYSMTMEARVDGTELILPVKVRVWDYTNRYLLGSPEDTEDVMELNTVEDSARLGADRYAPYAIEWEWPFEWGDDEHDTMLGNLAEDHDITLTVAIRIVAEYDIPNKPVVPGDPVNPDDSIGSDDPVGSDNLVGPDDSVGSDDPNPGLVKPPQTGDNSHLGFFILTAVISLLGIFATLFSGRSRDKDSGREQK